MPVAPLSPSCNSHEVYHGYCTSGNRSGEICCEAPESLGPKNTERVTCRRAFLRGRGVRSRSICFRWVIAQESSAGLPRENANLPALSFWPSLVNAYLPLARLSVHSYCRGVQFSSFVASCLEPRTITPIDGLNLPRGKTNRSMPYRSHSADPVS